MSDKISSYIAGEFDYEGGSLVFSCSKIELNLKPGEIIEDSFTMKEQSGQIIHVKVYSSNMVMKCNQEVYEGDEVIVSYKADTTGKNSGDVIKGEFQIISDMGEYVIPYVISIRHETIDSSLGNIKNLFHFTNLAKSDWTEAVKMFYRPDFISVLTGNDSRFRSLYKGLCVKGNPNRNLDEFLIGVNKKKAIEYTVDKSEFQLVNPFGMAMQTLRITRNGWGYLHLVIEKQGDFLVLEKETLSDDDFLGNICEYHFYVNEEALHEGNNYGCIRFIHSYGSFEITVHATRKMDTRRVRAAHQEKRMLYSLTRYYLDFRMKRLSSSKWMSQSRELLKHRQNIDADGLDESLFEAHLLLTQERYNEAKFILDRAVEDPEDLEDTGYCYYLYLTALYNGDEFYSQQVADKIMSIYRKNPKNWRIGWLLLYLPAECNRNGNAKWNFILQQIENGCHSPVIYLEALLLLNKTPSLLIYLQEAQLSILLFGAKQQYLSEELMMQIVTIAGRAKEYSRMLLKILIRIYEKIPQEETLRVICMQLMKGQCCDKESFVWYERGIEHNLPITKLYEYYMMSMDIHREQEIQKNALMYFSYQCTLPGDHAEYLYLYVVKNRKRFVDLYEAYASQIGRFLVKQLYAGKVNGNLAYLYQEILLKEMATPDNIRQFAEILFLNKICVEDEDIVNVIVLDDRLKEEMVYPVSNKNVYVSLFGNDHTILLEDAKGNRYYGTREYQTECYFFPRRFIQQVSEHAKDSIAYNLFACGDNKDLFAITPKNADRCRYLLGSDALDEEFKKLIQMNLLTYYFEQDETVCLEDMLEKIAAEDVPIKNRVEVVKYLSIHGFYEKAYQFTLYFGPENIEAKTIVRFARSLIEERNWVEGDEFTCMIYSAFERGKYNECVLDYLVRNYRGLSKNLRNIWRAASSFEVDTYEVCERLLLQILDTGAYVSDEEVIYKDYVQTGAKTDVNRAYLAYKSYEYLIHDRIVQEYIFEGIESLYHRNRTVPFVCMLAYLKFYSREADRLPEERKEVCISFLYTLYVDKNIVMPFYAEYKNVLPQARRIADNVMIEYRGNPQSTVMIHYIISRDGEEESSYIREEMKNMFGGIFVKEFLLFYGESLQYYVTESFGNREQLTESGTIQKKDELLGTSAGRYALINDIALSASLQDYTTAKEMLNDYAKQEFMTRGLFTLQ